MFAPTDQNLISAFLEGIKGAFQFFLVLGISVEVSTLVASKLRLQGFGFRVSDTDVAH